MHQLFAAIALVISTILPFGCSSPSNFANRAEEITTVNNFPYSVFVEAPAMQAFEIVTVSRGWTAERIVRWEPFVSAVMRRESGYCPNLRRGAKMTGKGCEFSKQGFGTDSGFGQVISIHYGLGRWMCVQEKLCSADDIIATPWNSMTALVALIEKDGFRPWCYTDALRAGPVCALAPVGTITVIKESVAK